jgi:hypothetical protein
MWLLNSKTQRLEQFPDPPPVRYAVLIHPFSPFGDDEDSSEESSNLQLSASKLGPAIAKVCELTQSYGLQYIWSHFQNLDVMTSSSRSEVINSLSTYYGRADICFAYLFDLPCGKPLYDESIWKQCTFWTQAWGLQPLVLPARVQFYDSKWHFRGEKATKPLPSLISRITGIDEDVLIDRRVLYTLSVARRMAWAAHREVERPEDIAYALLGIFGVCMPIIYGEGLQRAFQRLQEEIIKSKDDLSLLAWVAENQDEARGILARSPREFLHFLDPHTPREPIQSGNITAHMGKELLLRGSFAESGQDLYLDLGVFHERCSSKRSHGILLRELACGKAVRLAPWSLQFAPHHEVECTKIVEAIPDLTEARSPTRGWGQGRNDTEILKHRWPYLSVRPHTAVGIGDRESDLGRHCPYCTEGGSDWVLIPKDPPDITHYEYLDGYGHCNRVEIPEEYKNEVDLETRVFTPLSDSMITDDDPGSDSKARNENNIGPHGCDHQIHTLDPSSIATSRSWRASLASEAVRRFRVITKMVASEPKGWARNAPRIRRSARKRQNRIKTTVPEFACPFYRRDTKLYVDCVRHSSMRTIGEVKDHLWDYHRLPHYCPICKADFESLCDRDKHIVLRSCSFQATLPFKGISEDQGKLIFCKDSCISAKDSWFNIWQLLFPRHEPPESPYLNCTAGLQISGFRSFWRKNGQSFIEQYLKRWGISEVGGDIDLPSLSDLKSIILSEAISILMNTP